MAEATDIKGLDTTSSEFLPRKQMNIFQLQELLRIVNFKMLSVLFFIGKEGSSVGRMPICSCQGCRFQSLELPTDGEVSNYSYV
jgi:hypothetical protein